MTHPPDSAPPSAGLVLGVPRGVFPGQEDADVVFLPANEARGLAIPSVKTRLGTAGLLEVGVAVIDGRVVGYVDFAPSSPVGQACVVATIDAKGGPLERGWGPARRGWGEIALAGVKVLATGHFPLRAGGRRVEYAGRQIPVVNGAQVASYVERLSDSHQMSKLEGS